MGYNPHRLPQSHRGRANNNYIVRSSTIRAKWLAEDLCRKLGLAPGQTSREHVVIYAIFCHVFQIQFAEI